MRTQNKTSKQIAQHVVEQRNLQKIEASTHMLLDEVKALEEGNIAKYGNSVGSSADDLFNSKGSWKAVIEERSRNKHFTWFMILKKFNKARKFVNYNSDGIKEIDNSKSVVIDFDGFLPIPSNRYSYFYF